MKGAVWVLAALLAGCLASGAAARLIAYEDLRPLEGLVDIQGMWKALRLPALPPTFCHVGLVGWHCHNTTMHPWNPASIFPKNETPPMPADASCVICPAGWSGARRTAFDLLLDLPVAQRTGKLPAGFWNMQQLVDATNSAAAAAAAEQAGDGAGAAPGGGGAAAGA
ncbi:hypothetical protein HT031_001069 [Scenedesmus sp. PABB004]|nr:hypothetical protein HT031_001069 [Scenedesmus sp. PABB004]